MRSRVTFATTEAAAMTKCFASPSMQLWHSRPAKPHPFHFNEAAQGHVSGKHRRAHSRTPPIQPCVANNSEKGASSRLHEHSSSNLSAANALLSSPSTSCNVVSEHHLLNLPSLHPVLLKAWQGAPANRGDSPGQPHSQPPTASHRPAAGTVGQGWSEAAAAGALGGAVLLGCAFSFLLLLLPPGVKKD